MRHVIADSFDEQQFDEARNECADLRKQVQRADAQPTGAACEALFDLIADQFQMLKQPDPQFVNTPTPTLHEHVLSEMAETREFKHLKTLAQGDIANAAVGTSILAETLLDRVIGETALTEQLTKQHVDPNAPFDQAAHEAAVEIIRRTLRQAAQGALETIENINEADAMFGSGGGWGGNGGANVQRVPIEEKLKLAERMKRSQKLKNVVAMAGRFSRIALAKRDSVVREIPQTPADIGLGNNVARALASELALAGNPVTAPLFWEKYASGKLMQFEYEAREQLGGGPVVILLDDSGSMGGDPEVWAKSVVLAFAARCQRDKRDLYVRKFGGDGQTKDYVFKYRSEPDDPTLKARMLELVENFMSYGGTTFEEHLAWGAMQIGKPDTPFDKADLVMITDGYADVTPAFVDTFNEAKRKLDFQTFCIAVGHEAVSAQTVLGPVMDHFMYVTDFREEQDGNAATLNMLFANAN